MLVRRYLVGTLGALLWLAASASAGAQSVYRCPSRGAVLYSEKPCAGRVISTEQAHVPSKANTRDLDLHRLEQNRIAARALRRKPDESAEQFALRRRRAGMLEPDRAECARLDARMPVDQASLDIPDPAEVARGEAALKESKKRFSQLHC